MPLLRSLCLSLLLAASALHAETGPELGRRWQAFGQGLAAQGKLTGAAQAFDKAIALDPVSAAAFEARGRFRFKLGRMPEANADLKQAVTLDPSRTALAAWLATQEAPAAAPADAAASKVDHSEDLLEAQTLLDGGDAAAALPLFEKGSLQGATPSSVWGLGRVQALYALGRFNEARVVLAQARAKDPTETVLKRLDERYFHAGLDEDRGGGSPWGAMLRSLVLPGWGQVFNGQRRKGFTVGVLTLGLLGATVVTYVAADQALNDYRALGAGTSAADFDTAFSRADGMALTNQALGISFYTLYAYNILDAAAQARPAPVDTRNAAAARVTLLAMSF